MSLEILVPPLPLCQQLKPGDFPESAMVWFARDEVVIPRRGIMIGYPSAPATDEIMNDLQRNRKDKDDFVSIRFIFENGRWKVTNGIHTEYDENQSTAALRLWMRVNGREVGE